MKLRAESPRRSPIASQPPKLAKAKPEADFTAEGSPPPGKVGAGHPALPVAEPPRPAAAGANGTTRGKR